jgi:hypothetical protein
MAVFTILNFGIAIMERLRGNEDVSILFMCLGFVSLILSAYLYRQYSDFRAVLRGKPQTYEEEEEEEEALGDLDYMDDDDYDFDDENDLEDPE